MTNKKKIKWKFNKKEGATGWEIAGDIVLSLLQWIFVSACGFAYWMLVLFLISIFLLNVWHTNIDELLRYGIILSVVTSIVYGGVIIKRKLT